MWQRLADLTAPAAPCRTVPFRNTLQLQRGICRTNCVGPKLIVDYLKGLAESALLPPR